MEENIKINLSKLILFIFNFCKKVLTDLIIDNLFSGTLSTVLF